MGHEHRVDRAAGDEGVPSTLVEPDRVERRHEMYVEGSGTCRHLWWSGHQRDRGRRRRRRRAWQVGLALLTRAVSQLAEPRPHLGDKGRPVVPLRVVVVQIRRGDFEKVPDGAQTTPPSQPGGVPSRSQRHEQRIHVAPQPALADADAVRRLRRERLPRDRLHHEGGEVHPCVDRQLERAPEPPVDLHQLRQSVALVALELHHGGALPADRFEETDGMATGDGIDLGALAEHAHTAPWRPLTQAPVAERGHHPALVHAGEDPHAWSDQTLLQQHREFMRGTQGQVAGEVLRRIGVAHRGRRPAPGRANARLPRLDDEGITQMVAGRHVCRLVNDHAHRHRHADALGRVYDVDLVRRACDDRRVRAGHRAGEAIAVPGDEKGRDVGDRNEHIHSVIARQPGQAVHEVIGRCHRIGIRDGSAAVTRRLREGLPAAVADENVMAEASEGAGDGQCRPVLSIGDEYSHRARSARGASAPAAMTS